MGFKSPNGIVIMWFLPRNTAESTGRFPPTPTDHTAAKEIRVMAFGEPPPANANTPTMRSVMLKDILRFKSTHDIGLRVK